MCSTPVTLTELMTDLSKNDIVEAEIIGYGSDGMGVARIGGMAVFVSGAIAGERCRVRILKVLKNSAFARAEEVLEPSPERVRPDCPLYPACGGCGLRHMSYAEELRFKRTKVEDALRRIGGVELTLDAVHGAVSCERYRNKVQFPAAPGPRIGFYRARSHDVLDAADCLLQPESASRVRGAVLAWMREFNVQAYDEHTHTGLLRHIYVRAGSTGDSLVCLVVNAPAERQLPHEGGLVRRLRLAEPGITGIVVNYNTRPDNVILGDRYRTAWGESAMEETLCGLRFRLSVPSFFQVNRSQCEVLYSRALHFAALTGRETVLDLYCGIGTISLCLAGRAKRVIGAEIVPEAIDDARSNARANGVTNAEFFCGDASDIAARLEREGVRPDVVVVDPPRRGLEQPVIETIARMSPSRVVYVSCDPATLARDIKRFTGLSYVPQKSEAVDMFPRTEHVETVCLLSKLNVEHHIEEETKPKS